MKKVDLFLIFKGQNVEGFFLNVKMYKKRPLKSAILPKIDIQIAHSTEGGKVFKNSV